MKNRPYHLPAVFVALLCVLLAALAPACGNNGDPVDPSQQLCAGKTGFGARVTGRAEDVDACVSDDETTVLITTGSHYNVTAREVTSDVVFEFYVVFPVIGQDAPQILNLHDDLASAQADPLGVYFYYQEIPNQGETIESYQITDGVFTLSFSASDVLTATMSSIAFKMRTKGANPQDRGTRAIEKGFMSLSVDG